jgi:hypothetical protein
MARNALALALCLATAAAFVPAAKVSAPKTVQSATDFSQEDGVLPPMGYFDPAGFSKGDNAGLFPWCRQAEIKHGRVAMVATTGWLLQNNGYFFPGKISTAISDQQAYWLGPPGAKTIPEVEFSSLGKNAIEQWINMPAEGKAQIGLVIFVIEVATELQKPHYMKGGKLGYIELVSKGMSGVDMLVNAMPEEQRKKRRTIELQNGRLAMIGIASFGAAAAIPGSVPLIPASWCNLC